MVQGELILTRPSGKSASANLQSILSSIRCRFPLVLVSTNTRYIMVLGEQISTQPCRIYRCIGTQNFLGKQLSVSYYWMIQLKCGQRTKITTLWHEFSSLVMGKFFEQYAGKKFNCIKDGLDTVPMEILHNICGCQDLLISLWTTRIYWYLTRPTEFIGSYLMSCCLGWANLNPANGHL